MPTILIAEDSMYQRRKIRRTLEQEGYNILEATNGKECLAIATKQPTDCILLDLLMPEVNGIEVLQTLQTRNIKVPVVVNTADIQDSTRQKCLELGAVAFLNKPIREKELRRTIGEALKKNRQLEPLENPQ